MYICFKRKPTPPKSATPWWWIFCFNLGLKRYLRSRICFPLTAYDMNKNKANAKDALFTQWMALLQNPQHSLKIPKTEVCGGALWYGDLATRGSPAPETCRATLQLRVPIYPTHSFLLLPSPTEGNEKRRSKRDQKVLCLAPQWCTASV